MIGQFSTPTHSTQFEEIVNNRTPGPPKYSQVSSRTYSPTDETPSAMDNRLDRFRFQSVQTTEPSVETTEPLVQTTELSVQESEPPIRTAGQEDQSVNNPG